MKRISVCAIALFFAGCAASKILKTAKPPVVFTVDAQALEKNRKKV